MVCSLWVHNLTALLHLLLSHYMWYCVITISHSLEFIMHLLSSHYMGSSVITTIHSLVFIWPFSRQPKIKRWCCSILQDLISRIPATKEMSHLQWIKLLCLYAPFSPLIRNNYKFHIPFILIYHENTSILQVKGAQKYKKKIPRLSGGAMKIQHYSDVIMDVMVSQITSLSTVYSTVYSGTDQRKHQSSESLAFVRGIHQWLVNSLHKWPVTRKMFPFDDVIMYKVVPEIIKWCWKIKKWCCTTLKWSMENSVFIIKLYVI